VPKIQKYDEFILPEMLRQAFMHDSLNLEGLATIVKQWP
jgi:hypothetical protein